MGIDRLIGDSGRQGVTHLYGWNAAKQQLFLITAIYKDNNDVGQLNCRGFQMSAEFGANLDLAPDGTLYNMTNTSQLQVIVPAKFADTAKKVVITANDLATYNDSTFRTPGTIETVPGLTLAAETNIILAAGQGVSLRGELHVRPGAQLRVRTSVGQ